MLERTTTIRAIDDTNHSVLTVWKASRDAASTAVTMLSAPKSAGASAYRLIAHKLLRSGARRIFVTSPSRSEKRAILSVNIALAIAEHVDANPVLLDLDSETWRIAALLGISNETTVSAIAGAGGSQALIELDDLQLGIGVQRLSSGAQLIVDLGTLDSFLTRVENAQYGPIIINGPAGLGIAEANIIHDLCDSLVIAVKAGKTRATAVRSLVRQLGAEAAPLIALQQG